MIPFLTSKQTNKIIQLGIILSLVLLCGGILYLSKFGWLNEQILSQDERMAIRGMAPGIDSKITSTSSSSKEAQEFREIVKKAIHAVPLDKVREYYLKIGPQAMISILNEKSYCHEIGHNFGRVISEKAPNLESAINVCGQSCTGGCMHGIMMGLFISPNGEHVQFNQVRDKIASLCDKDQIKKNLDRGGCIHGIGHLLEVLADYDNKMALGNCDIFTDKGENFYCQTGVYMERHVVYGQEDAKKSEIYPCDEAKYPAACFRYKLMTTFPLSQWKEASNFCQKLGSDRMVEGCMHGLGFSYYELLSEEPALINDLCESADPIAARLCIEGAAGSLTLFNKSQANTVCKYIDESNKKVCNQAVKSTAFGMDLDFSLYTR